MVHPKVRHELTKLLVVVFRATSHSPTATLCVLLDNFVVRQAGIILPSDVVHRASGKVSGVKGLLRNLLVLAKAMRWYAVQMCRIKHCNQHVAMSNWGT